MLILLDPRSRQPGGLRINLWLAQRNLRLARRRARERQLVRAVGRRIARKVKQSAPALDGTGEAAHIQTALARVRDSYEARSFSLATTVILSEEFEQHLLPTWHLRRALELEAASRGTQSALVPAQRRHGRA